MNKKTTGTDSLLKTSTALAVLALFAGTASAQTPAQPSGAPSTSDRKSVV